jgi:hypothetical protein
MSHTRRDLLRAAALATAAPLLSADDKWKRGDEMEARLEAFFAETDSRPEFVWTNREDVMYHDMDYPPALADSPDFCAFMRVTWVFNRAMEWVRDSGAILCFENGGALDLTGANQISSWHTGSANKLASEGEWTRWTKNSDRRRDGAILPSLQFHAGQHPELAMEVAEADADWQLIVTPKGRCGRPLIATSWRSGPGEARIDLAGELARAGFDWNYPELHFAIGTWNQDPAHSSSLRFRIRLLPRAAVVGCLPVIRTPEREAQEGVPLLAVVIDERGRRLSGSDVRVRAAIGDRTEPLRESGGLWKATLRGLKEGDYTVTVESDGSVRAATTVDVRVTDGNFFGFDHEHRWIIRDKHMFGPLSGSYQGTFFFRNAGEPGERMVQGQAEWNAWDRSQPGSEHMHYWESLKPAELDERFRYVAENGFDLLTLHQHWGQWERLDAGGRIAPHGAEQLARYLRTASRYGLGHIQALSSGPYGRVDQKPNYGGTVPYSRYLDEGFETKQFAEPGSHFDELFHQYLRDFGTLFSDETALFAMTGSGEGDHFSGPRRANDTMNAVRGVDRNHMFLAETVLMMQKLPEKHSAGYEQTLFGGRTYFAGTRELPEYDIGVEFKFFQMAGMYMAEGSWPPMLSYTRLHYDVLHDDNGSPRNWTGSEWYRNRWRDSLYLGLVHRLPIINSWDEEFAEDEHMLFRRIREQVNWAQPFAPAPLTIEVDDTCANVDNPARANLTKHVQVLARMGLMCRFVADGGVLDGRRPFSPPAFRSQGGALPDELKSDMPVAIEGPYASSYAWSADRRTMLAYVYNVSNHARDYIWLGGNYHRQPRPAPLRISVQNLPASSLRVTLYDLNTKQVLDTSSNGRAMFDPGITSHDFFVLVTPHA